MYSLSEIKHFVWNEMEYFIREKTKKMKKTDQKVFLSGRWMPLPPGSKKFYMNATRPLKLGACMLP